jgi:hypothetical protein
MRTLPLSCLPLLLTACPGQDATVESWQCEAEATVLELDEVSTLGFSGQDLLDSVAGPHSETLDYRGELPASTITLELIHDGGEVRFVHQEEPSRGFLASAKDTAWFEPCPDYLEVDVEVSLVSLDGLWDERFPASIASGDRPFIEAMGSETLALEELGGSYTPWHFDAAGVRGAVTIDFRIVERGPKGQITAFVLEPCDTGLCRTHALEVASWP